MAIRLRNSVQIDPIDVSDRNAVGIRFPFNKRNIFSLDYTTKDHAKSKLFNVLVTSPGERINQPLYGAGLKNRLFEQQTSIAEEELRNYVLPQVDLFVPEIQIKEIKLSKGGIQGHKLFVTVSYSFLNNGEEDSITVSFTNDNFQSNY